MSPKCVLTKSNLTTAISFLALMSSPVWAQSFYFDNSHSTTKTFSTSQNTQYRIIQYYSAWGGPWPSAWQRDVEFFFQISGGQSVSTTVPWARTAFPAESHNKSQSTYWNSGDLTQLEVTSGWNGGLYTGSAGPLYAIPMATPITPEQALSGAVHFQASAGGMTGTLVPNLGLTLVEAAGICGVDHFNWLQWVTYDNDPNRPRVGGSRVNAPYIDPPLGGYDNDPSDLNPAYWDETPLYNPSYYYEAHVDGSSLFNFVDYPTVTSGSEVHFRTMLVGVSSDETLVTFPFLQGYEWDSKSVGAVVVRGNIDPSLISVAESTLRGTFSIGDITSSELAYLESQGVVVPEPTYVAFLVGVLPPMLARRRETRGN